MIKRFAFVAYSVADVPQSVAFYRDVMGLELDAAAYEKSGGYWAEFAVGDGTFGVGNGTPLGFLPGSGNGAVFEVDDLQAERTRLLEAGVRVSDVHDGPACMSAFVTDPEGNTFGIHQMKS